MKILIVSAMFPPIRTGTSFYTKNVAETLTKMGHDVAVVTVKNKDYSAEEQYSFKLFRIKAIHFTVKNYFKHLRICSLYLNNYKFLKNLIKNEKYEAVLLVNHYLDIAFPAIYGAKKNKTPLFISVGTQMQSTKPFRNKLLKILDRLICGNFIFPACKNIISWDYEIQRYIQEVQKGKISKKSVIIGFGVNGNLDIYKNYCHDYSNISQIIGVGAIIDQRDFLFQIKVFKELLHFFPELKLKIIGHIYIDKPIKLAKELGIDNKVVFTGEMPHDVVLSEMKRSVLHWMMLSGNYKGLGTSTIESMLLGIPAISNAPENLLGNNELKDMHNYIFSDGIDVAHSVKKVLNVLQNEQLRKTIGNNGAEFVKQYLNWDSVGEKMIRLFKGNDIE